MHTESTHVCISNTVTSNEEVNVLHKGMRCGIEVPWVAYGLHNGLRVSHVPLSTVEYLTSFEACQLLIVVAAKCHFHTATHNSCSDVGETPLTCKIVIFNVCAQAIQSLLVA